MPSEVAAGDVADTSPVDLYGLMCAMQARFEQTGKMQVGDPNTGRIESSDHPWSKGEEIPVAKMCTAPKVYAPPRRENIARPRERRAASRRRARAPSGDDPSEPDPPLHVIPPSAFRAECDRLFGESA